jgi:hypothetical protein
VILSRLFVAVAVVLDFFRHPSCVLERINAGH